MSKDLYERLEARRRAISNWKRLKIVIVILKMCNGRIEKDGMNMIKDGIEENPPTFDDWFTKFVIFPTSKYLISWQLFMTLVYLLAILLDAFVIAFRLVPLSRSENVNSFQMAFSLLMVADIISKFFIATKHGRST